MRSFEILILAALASSASAQFSSGSAMSTGPSSAQSGQPTGTRGLHSIPSGGSSSGAVNTGRKHTNSAQRSLTGTVSGTQTATAKESKKTNSARQSTKTRSGTQTAIAKESKKTGSARQSTTKTLSETQTAVAKIRLQASSDTLSLSMMPSHAFPSGPLQFHTQALSRGIPTKTGIPSGPGGLMSGIPVPRATLAPSSEILLSITFTGTSASRTVAPSPILALQAALGSLSHSSSKPSSVISVPLSKATNRVSKLANEAVSTKLRTIPLPSTGLPLIPTSTGFNSLSKPTTFATSFKSTIPTNTRAISNLNNAAASTGLPTIPIPSSGLPLIPTPTGFRSAVPTTFVTTFKPSVSA